MSKSQLTFRGIAPIYSPLSLQLGRDQFSKEFIQSLKAVNLQNSAAEESDSEALIWKGKLTHLGGQQSESRQYQSTENNSKDVRLMCWSPADDSHVVFHVFSNHIAIAEIELTIDLTELSAVTDETSTLVSELESQVQTLAKAKIETYTDDFIQDLKQVSSSLPKGVEYSEAKNAQSGDWVARTMVINDEQMTLEHIPEIIREWLKKTSRPQDAEDIIEGRKEYSMTWLNYVVKNAKAVGEDTNIQMMVLAQYYYVSQENCNSDLRGAIEAAYSGTKVKAVKRLAYTRTSCRLNQIAFYENIKFLNRPNRVLLEGILSGWQFHQLVENSERMIEICNARLQEEDNQKRERSTVMTDFLLVALSFFAVFELSLYLTEFSREMMSRPALDYNDSNSSFFLSIIAEIDADIMFSFGFGLTLVLILFYRYIKRN